MAVGGQQAVQFGIGVLFDIVRDAVVVADTATERILLWNDGASEIFGYTAAEAIGMELGRLVPEQLRPQHEAGFRRFADSGTAPLIESGHAVELPALHKDGTTRWIELRLSALPSPDTDGLFVMALIRDVTERRDAHAELASANAELARANAALRDFLSLASHDFKNPITAIAAASEMLLEDRSARPDREMLVEIIQRQARWLSDLLTDFEVVARAEAGALAPAPASVVVRDLVVDVASNAGDVTVAADTASSAFVDPLHLRRIVANLLQNATKYGQPPVVASVREKDDGIVVSILDHGPGVPPEERSRLFEKFWRARRTDAPGTGLGLAIVRALAEANGGRAWFTQDEYPSFNVWLPAKDSDADAGDVQEGPTAARARTTD